MKHILMFARDPGGANALAPVYQELQKSFSVSLYGKEFALGVFEANGLQAKNIQMECTEITQEAIYKFLKQKRPDFLLTGSSLNDYTERYLWKAAKQLGIRSAVILDQWMNMGIRFSSYSYGEIEEYRREMQHPYLPDRILVMDELAKEILCKEGISKECIYITGQPHFDTILRRYERTPWPDKNEKYHICYVSEPLWENYDKGREDSYWGYNEKTNFQTLYKCLEKLAEQLQRQVELVIRPHPREKTKEWERLLDNGSSKWIHLRMDKENDSFTLLKKMDLICGMSSMFLLEAAICGKPVVSIQIGLKRDNPFVLSMLGICQTQLSEDELENRLLKALIGKEERLEFRFIEDAAKKVAACVEKEMQENE